MCSYDITEIWKCIIAISMHLDTIMDNGIVKSSCLPTNGPSGLCLSFQNYSRFNNREKKPPLELDIVKLSRIHVSQVNTFPCGVSIFVESSFKPLFEFFRERNKILYMVGGN